MRGCNTPGSTHYSGCDCHEEGWIKRLDLERAEIIEIRLANRALQIALSEVRAQLTSAQEKLGVATEALESISKFPESFKDGHYYTPSGAILLAEDALAKIQGEGPHEDHRNLPELY